MNRYFKEVIDAHQLIEQWLGRSEASAALEQRLLSRFSTHYSMMTATGIQLDFCALKQLFQQQQGALPGLKIDISSLHLVLSQDSGAIVTYQERQQLPDNSSNLRFSTVVFEVDSSANILWRHLHETYLKDCYTECQLN